jgi:hypothetical protein
MKPLTKVLILVLLLGSLYPAQYILQSFARKRQYNWAVMQSKRCSTLCNLLYQHHEKYGKYPEVLHDLVVSKMIDEPTYLELMFQQKSSAEPQEWRYHKPINSSETALFSGDPVTAWNCPISTYILGRTDGSVIAFGEEKLPNMIRNLLKPSHLPD